MRCGGKESLWYLAAKALLRLRRGHRLSMETNIAATTTSPSLNCDFDFIPSKDQTALQCAHTIRLEAAFSSSIAVLMSIPSPLNKLFLDGTVEKTRPPRTLTASFASDSPRSRSDLQEPKCLSERRLPRIAFAPTRTTNNSPKILLLRGKRSLSTRLIRNQ